MARTKLHVTTNLAHRDAEAAREYDTDKTPAVALETAVADILRTGLPRRGDFRLTIEITRAADVPE